MGTTSPNSYTDQRVLTINGTTYGRLDLEVSGTLRGSIWANSGGLGIDAGANDIEFFAGSSERLRIASDGDLHIGGTTRPDPTTSGFTVEDGGKYVRWSNGGGTSGTTASSLAIYGGGSSTNVLATTSWGGAIYLFNTNNTDGNSNVLSFGNSNQLATSFIIGENTSHSSRNGELAFATSSGSAPAERLRITSDGDVGIGTTSPTNQFHVYDSAAANDTPEIKIEAFRPALRFKDRSSNSVSAEIVGDNSLKFRVSTPVDDSTPLTERMRIDSGGNVGIGTTSPAVALDVQGGTSNTGIAVRSTDTRAQVSYIDNATTGIGCVCTGGEGDDFFIRTGSDGAKKLTIKADGKVGIGTGAPEELLHIKDVTAPGIQLEATGGGPYKSLIKMGGNDMEIRGSSGNIEFFTGNADGDSSTERLRIHSDGKVSLGTSSSASSKFNISHGNELALYTSGPYNFQAKFESTDAEAAIVIEDSNSTDNANRIGVITNDMTFITNNSENLRITSTGTINFSNTTIATKNTSGDIVIDFGNLTNNGGNNWRKCGVWILYNGIDPDATDNKSVIYYTGVGSVTTWNWVGDTDTLSNDSFNSVTLQNAATTGFRLYCDVNNQNTGSVTVLIHAWNTKPTITIN